MFTLPLVFSALAAVRLAYAQSYASTTTFTFTGSSLPTGLASYQYVVPDDDDATRYDHEFVPEMTYPEGGYLNLLVPGGQQNDEVIWSAEVQTTFTVSSAKVDTWAILTDVAGVCNGMFLYQNDNQESDIEWLSDSISQSNIDAGIGRALWYTNQKTTSDGNSTSEAGTPPTDAASAVHKYSLEWANGATTFFLDDKQQYRFTTNVPSTKAAYWIWNNWSNGDPNWSAGPPATDAVFRIQKIVMQYNS